MELKEVKEETRRYLSELSSRLEASVEALPDLNWTRCHGDCHGGNAHIVTEGPNAGQAQFFDFDDGGFGYLAYDLAVHLWAQVSFHVADMRCGLLSSMAIAPSVQSRRRTLMR
jgi:Ser/Thr protein kinase RdoA (MazF antagonist)